MTTSQTASRVKIACPCGKTYRCRPKAAGQPLRCRACGASVTPIDVAPIDVAPIDVAPVDTWSPLMLLTITGGIVLSLGLLQTLLDGKTFMFVYLTFAFVCVVVGAYLRSWKIPTFVAGFLPLLAFEAIGLIRLWYGSSHGMHRFNGLKFLMCIAPAFLILLFAKDDVGNEHSYSSSCGGGGGGGGGGCGGGCGGCGGD
jgi:hypothetical protein